MIPGPWSAQVSFRESGLAENDCSTWKRANQTGICSSRGRQPAAGLTPLSLYSASVACWSAGLSPAYSFCRRFSSGCSNCMARIERVCFRVSGNSTTPTATVSRMMATPRLGIRP